MDMGFFLQEERIFPGVHKIDAPISGPRIADTNFTDTRIFLIMSLFMAWSLASYIGASPSDKAARRP